jgi:hypothetical protein
MRYVFKRLWTHGEYAESIKPYSENRRNTTKLGLFAVHKIVSEYAEGI